VLHLLQCQLPKPIDKKPVVAFIKIDFRALSGT
jgi:hypothetical protein